MCTLDVALNIEDTKIRSGKTPGRSHPLPSQKLTGNKSPSLTYAMWELCSKVATKHVFMLPAAAFK